MKPIRVLLTNWESADNLGDYAILRAQVGLLEAHSGAEVLILGNQPGAVLPTELANHHQGDFPWSNPFRGGMLAWLRGLVACSSVLLFPCLAFIMPSKYRRVVRLFRGVDVVMPKGGGYLFGNKSLRKTLFLVRTLCPLFLARRLHIRRALWGHSIGPVEGRINRALVRLALQDADIVVRDDSSVALCKSLGLEAQRAPDLALLTRFGISHARVPTLGSGGAERIGVTAKRVSCDPSQQQRYIDAMAKAIDAIREKAAFSGRGLRVFLVPQVIGPTPFEDDRSVLEELGALLVDVDWCVQAPPDSVMDAMKVYGSCDFLLATRLHSAILAACAGTPFAVFGYVGGKARGAVADLGLPDWTTTDSVDSLVSTVIRCYDARESLAAQARVGLVAARERLHALSLVEALERLP